MHCIFRVAGGRKKQRAGCQKTINQRRTDNLPATLRGRGRIRLQQFFPPVRLHRCA